MIQTCRNSHFFQEKMPKKVPKSLQVFYKICTISSFFFCQYCILYIFIYKLSEGICSCLEGLWFVQHLILKCLVQIKVWFSQASKRSSVVESLADGASGVAGPTVGDLSGMDVSAGVRPPNAPTTDGVSTDGCHNQTNLDQVCLNRSYNTKQYCRLL